MCRIKSTQTCLDARLDTLPLERVSSLLRLLSPAEVAE